MEKTNCPKCGIEISKKDRFCSNCGNPIHVVCPSCGSHVSNEAKFCSQCGYNLHVKLNINTKNDISGASLHSSVGSHLEANTQFQKYHNPRAGHGFAAEDSNALNDILSGKHVDKSGLSNAKNGADRIVNGTQYIQTKYCQSAQKTVNAAFDQGNYRYPGQQLEVPKDQYQECIKLFKDKIKNGEVKDINGKTITEPEAAEKLVKEGSITYQQAQNIAKGGNIDSLIFDAKNNAISTTYIAGLSFAISFARYKWAGMDTSDALKNALYDGFQYGGFAFLTGVVTSQVLRTQSAAFLTTVMRPGVKTIYHTTVGKAAIEKIAQASLGKTVTGMAAVNHVSKLLRSNVVTSGVVTLAVTAPDIYRAAFAKNISWAQFSKNLMVNVAGVAAGTGGWMAGAAGGAALGSAVPIIGTAVGGVVGGVLGALAGGVAGSAGIKAGLDCFIKDDAEEMIELLQEALSDLAYDYLLLDHEITFISERVKERVDSDWLKAMYGFSSDNAERKVFAYKSFVPDCNALIKARSYIELPSPSDIDIEAENILSIYNSEIKHLAIEG